MKLCLFTRWCLDPKGRTPLTINPMEVSSVEWFTDSYDHPYDPGGYPAAAKIIMKSGKREYIVKGTVEEVTNQLNNGKTNQ